MASDAEMHVSLTKDQDPKALLKFYLSTQSYLSPESSTSIALEYPKSASTSPPSHYTSIGQGQCAEIFYQRRPVTLALEKAHPPQEKHAEVVNDSVQHKKVCTAFKKYGKLCHVPKYHSLIPPDNEDWYRSYGRCMPTSRLEIAKGRKERTPILTMGAYPASPVLSP
jgi:hypothetical protein